MDTQRSKVLLQHSVRSAYPGKLAARVFFTCLIAATGGLIFGYELGVSGFLKTGGITAMDVFLKEFFPSVYEESSSVKPSDDRLVLSSAMNVPMLVIGGTVLALDVPISAHFFNWDTFGLEQKLVCEVTRDHHQEDSKDNEQTKLQVRQHCREEFHNSEGEDHAPG
ncbi:unnamed protein product [Dovyalis caffra]|uniref:Uncharacterized protein n=1 Tax=Dovyalis caffra TaxID=77055 RepID=A0AAV1S9I6_9ROSI|nr:unnamed protein product [Dovyalis caffra]